MNQTRRLLLTMILCLGLLSLSGCVTRQAVFVEPGTIIRTGPDVSGRVYVQINGEWILTDNKVDIPEGLYIVTPNENDEG